MLKSLSNSDILKPSFDLSHGYRYLKIEELLKMNPSEVIPLLEELVEAGILQRAFEEKYVVCPSCKSSNVGLNYFCPHCGSTTLERKALIEHTPCGNIHSIDLDKVEGFVCPDCNREFSAGNYKKTENWIECSKCEKRLYTLSLTYKCRECGANFDFGDAFFRNGYSYRLNGAAREDIQRGLLFSSFLKDSLAKLGYKIEALGSLQGKSKVKHEFDFVVTNKDGKHIAVDVMFSEKGVTVADIINEYGKVFDVKTEVYLVVYPRPSKEVERVAKTYKLNIVSADDPKEAIARLIKTLKT